MSHAETVREAVIRVVQQNFSGAVTPARPRRMHRKADHHLCTFTHSAAEAFRPYEARQCLVALVRAVVCHPTRPMFFRTHLVDGMHLVQDGRNAFGTSTS